VTDLTAGDFTILEDGVPQTLAHFSTQAFTPDGPVVQPPDADGARTGSTAAAEPASRVITPQTSRVYLIVLGRGRLQIPNKGIDGVLHFVRNRLLPQDRVALLAYNRATGFTTDHASLIPILERYVRAHEAIEVKLTLHFSGLAGLYRAPDIPPAIQADIDRVFGGTGTAAARTVPAVTENRDRTDADYRRRVADALIGDPSASLSGKAEAAIEGLTFDAFVATTVTEGLDIGNINAGIDYLRHVDGEKRLIYVASGGFKTSGFAGTLDGLARAASHARVALDVVHTGGIEYRYASSEPRTIAAQLGIGTDPFDAYLRGGTTIGSAQTARMLAKETGGTFNANRYRTVADDLTSMDQAARFHYTLGYYPAPRAADGAYRRIEVRSTRPGITLRFRGGYYARPMPAVLGKRELLSYTRISRAFQYAQPIDDITVRGRAVVTRGPNAARQLRIDVTIDASRVTYEIVDGRHVGSVEVVVFALDGRQRQVADLWQRVELNLSPATYEQFMAGGIPHTATLTVPADARAVKVVVYDYAADLLGSVVLAAR
jgi:VWFA-related protein